MKAFSYPVGTRVTKYGRTTKGTVISNTLASSNDFVAVEWENGVLEKVSVKDIRSTPSEMDEDFEQIRSSIAECCASFKDASALADKYNISLRDMEYSDDDMSFNELENMVNNVPWMSSSNNC